MKTSHGFDITQCQTPMCRKEMFFAPTEAGKQIPLDKEPNPKGNIFIRGGKAIYVSKKNPAPDGSELFMSHFATCTHPETYRTKKE